MRVLGTMLRAAVPWAALVVLFLINRLVEGSIPARLTFAIDLTATLLAAVYFLYLLMRRRIHIGWSRKEFDAVEEQLSRREAR